MSDRTWKYVLIAVIVVMMLIGFFLIAWFAGAFGTAGSDGESVKVVSVKPAIQQQDVGQQGNIEIQIDGIDNLYGVDIGLQFDPKIIQIQDMDPGQDGVQIQAGSFLSPDVVITNQADNMAGTISYIVAQKTPSPPAGGSGIVAVITFRAVAKGETNVSFTAVKLSDPDGNKILVDTQPGRVIVDVVFTPTPTIPLPTVTPIPAPSLTPIPPTSTPLPPNMIVPPGATVGFCYRAQACETLACIGQKFGVDPNYLNLVNDLSPPGHVFMHQALFIPTTYGHGPNVYIVKSGDTLFSVADACHLPLDFLAWANCLPENANLEPGHVLEIPIPPFPPPSRYAYPGSVAPSVPSNKPLPPPSVGCRGGCSSGACGSNW